MRKKLVVLCLMGILTLGLGSAALVDYLSNTVRTEVKVESPFELDDTYWTFDGDLIAGDGQFLLVNITNKADVSIDATADLYIEKWDNGNWTAFDGNGIYVAVSDDIQYAFDDTHNPSHDPWKTWMQNNWDWFDWMCSTDSITDVTMTQEINDTYAPIYNDVPNGTSCKMIRYKNYEMIDPNITTNMSNNPDIIPGAIIHNGAHFYTYPVPTEPGTYPIVVKISADPALEPGTYRFSLKIMPP